MKKDKQNENIDIKDVEVISDSKDVEDLSKGIKVQKDEFEEDLKEQYKDYKLIDFKAFGQFLKEVKTFLFGITLEKSHYVEKNEKEIRKQISFPIKFGLMSILITLGFFGVWSSFAPLDSASIAEGFVMVSDHRKQIQHFEGGIVEKIYVKDGDTVEKGQVLLTLNESKTKSELEKTLWQLRYALAVEARLTESIKFITLVHSDDMEKASNMELFFDNEYLESDDEKIQALKTAQKNSFNMLKAYILGSMNTYDAQEQEFNSEILSTNERIKSQKENIKTLEIEYKKKQKLLEKKLDISHSVAQVKIELQRYKGEILELEAKMSGYKHKIAEVKSRKINFVDERNVNLSEEYKRNHTELLNYEAQYIQVKDSHERSVIKAPYAGVITDLKVHTVGGSVRHADVIMEIIPQDGDLIIEAFIPSHEIESISIGSNVRIQLNAYKARLVPRIEGTVTYISADKFDQQAGPGQPGQQKFAPVGYYKAKITVSPEELEKVNTIIKLYPGMPVTAFIVKGTRSFAEYLYSPIKDSFHRAFKEP